MNAPVFIITSSINPDFGLIQSDTRLQQTLQTVSSIRKYASNARVVLVDSSRMGISVEVTKIITSVVDIFFDLGDKNPGLDIVDFSRIPFNYLSSLKAISEAYAVHYAVLKLQAIGYLDNCSRIFKISGRYFLNNNFDITKHMDGGKDFCFKSRTPTWTNSYGFLYCTILYSFSHPSECGIMSILSSAIQSAISDGVDLEHAMYKCINPRSVYEIETIGVQGIIASTGKEVFE